MSLRQQMMTRSFPVYTISKHSLTSQPLRTKSFRDLIMIVFYDCFRSQHIYFRVSLLPSSSGHSSYVISHSNLYFHAPDILCFGWQCAVWWISSNLTVCGKPQLDTFSKVMIKLFFFFKKKFNCSHVVPTRLLVYYVSADGMSLWAIYVYLYDIHILFINNVAFLTNTFPIVRHKVQTARDFQHRFLVIER